jgi:hypothetical protein
MLRRRNATGDIKLAFEPEEVAHVVHASSSANGTLVLVADSPEWAARLRYRANELGFSSVEVKVRPRCR